ncbi:MAG: VWA domain-containing protein [Hyphomonadaceae bacterium]|nr:VWA domain-containing protein [Hyphomonadaceae bacterium]
MSATRTLTDFIRALRSAEVQVSPAEAIDAAGAMRLVGYADRTALKSALRPALAKSEAEAEAFDRLFDLYFARQASAPRPQNSDADRDQTAPPQDMLELAQSGDEAAIQAAMERAGQASGVQDIRFSTQTAYFAQKMLKQLGVEQMEAKLLEALQARTPEGEAEAGEMIAARRDMLMRARAYAEAQFDVFGQGATEAFREDVLTSKPISALDLADLKRMRALVEKVAKRLAVKHSRRRRNRSTGQLDVRATLRANAGLGGVPFRLHWKQKKRDKAKIVVICDVSSSVARYVRFLLLLLHSLGDVIPELRAFAFSSRLGEVTDELDSDQFEGVMERILRQHGMGSTDYGQALWDLKTSYPDIIDRRTSVIILGDGRSNYGDPRMDLFKEICARAKRVIWLSPEPESMWGTGDSVLPRYRTHAHAMGRISTLTDLERTLDRVLALYD